MKKGTIDMMKFTLLKNRLRQPKYVIIGILESLWQLTLSSATDGAIGRFTDEEIAAWIEWDGDPSLLIEHLVSTRFLDRCKVNRLVVHDWSEHAPDFLKNSFKRWGKDFVVPIVVDAEHDAQHDAQHPLRDDAKNDACEHPPIPLQPSPANKETNTRRNAVAYSDEFKSWWLVYPRREAKGEAWKAWPKAIAWIRQTTDSTQEQAVASLMEITKRFASSPKGQGEFVPQPATFLNGKRWEDDQKSWEKRNGNETGTGNNRPSAGGSNLLTREQARESQQLGVISNWVSKRSLPSGGVRSSDGALIRDEADCTAHGP